LHLFDALKLHCGCAHYNALRLKKIKDVFREPRKSALF